MNCRQSSTSQDDSDDSDIDVKRDILKGMSQATCGLRQLPLTSEADNLTTSSTGTRSPSEAQDHKLWRRTADNSKNRLLMPELMENSETESAKNSGGSMESESEPPVEPTVEGKAILPPSPSKEGPFPSLPDSFLKKLDLHVRSKYRSEQLSDSDLEIKFNSLCLAFKTDCFTLTNRLELHQRQHSLAEKNVNEEITALKENLNALSQICSEDETRKLVKNLYHHLEVLHQSTTRLSSRAEVYGAVQQEERTNRVIEVILSHVDNLKRSHDKKIQELEDMKHILAENNLLSEELSEGQEGREGKEGYHTIRTFSTSGIGSGKLTSRRRASIAALPRSADKLDGRTKFATFVANAASRNLMCNIDTRRCPQMCSLRSFTTQDRFLVPDKSNISVADEFVNRHEIEQNNNEKFCDGNESLVKSIQVHEKSENTLSAPETLLSVKSVASEPTSNIPSLEQDISSADGATSNVVSAEENEFFSLFQEAQQSYVTDQTDEEEDEKDCNRVSKHTFKLLSSNISEESLPLLSTHYFSKWFHCSEHWQSFFRYGLSGFLFLAALFSLLLTFMPLSTSASQCQARTSSCVDEWLQKFKSIK